MSEPLYRIKPLVWETNEFCTYTEPRAYGVHGFEDTTIRALYYVQSFYSPVTLYKGDSIEDAKAACEAHYRNRLMEALEEVSEG